LLVNGKTLLLQIRALISHYQNLSYKVLE